MGSGIVTRLQVDVIVQAALLGPLEATEWTPLTADPDALGRLLLSSGRRKSGERTGEDYSFQTLPIALTAIEISKACAYYRYNRSKVPAIVARVAAAVEPHLPGWRDAPWGWDDEDVTARLGRPASGSDTPAPLDPALVEVSDRLESVGLTTVSIDPTVGSDLTREAGRTGRFLGTVLARYGETGFAQVAVHVADSSETAEKVFPSLVGRMVWGQARGSDLSRVGSLLVMVDRGAAVGIEESLGAVARLGAPDEAWSSFEEPLATLDGGLVADQVPMRIKGHPVVARTRPELQTLIAMIEQPDLRERLASVDLKEHSVLALPEMPVGAVSHIEVVRSGSTAEGARLTEDVVITSHPAPPRPSLGSILLTPKLRRIPATVRVRSPQGGRFVGMWKNVARLPR